MKFNNHYNLDGKHAFLGASKYHWTKWDEEKLATSYQNHKATLMGTRLHELAAEHIALGIKMPRNKQTLSMYVNDAIGYNMRPEQVLYYSDNCFGTADAISFRNNLLRIHDLKTGVTPVKIDQLLVYAALFCLEYQIKPSDIDMELRIYQLDDVMICNPTADDVYPIMEKIVAFDKVLNQINQEED